MPRAYDWLWETLATELGTTRAAALRAAFEARRRADILAEQQARAAAELPALRTALDVATRSRNTNEMTKFHAMIAKRERQLATPLPDLTDG